MIISLVLIVSVLALLVALGLARWVLKMDNGTPEMRTISDAIQEGAQAFLKRQYRTIALLSVVVGLIIFLIYQVVRAPSPNDPHEVSRLWLALATTASFFFGALCSGIAGYVGMFVSIRSNIRAASAARTSLNRALQAALRGGAVSGLFVVAMSLLGVGGLYFLVHSLTSIPDTKIPLIIVGYGFGASFVALFAQLGGGIYTKAADVGADLVGKVEAGIPEDDPRNPAVIADLVGDNVGDCAGRGADLFESTAAENIGAMILGATLALRVQAANPGAAFSIIGVMLVKAREDEDPMQALNRGYWVTAVLAAVGFVAGTYWLLQFPGNPDAWWHYAAAGVIGIATSIAFVYITQYYTEYRFRPVKAIAAASVTGPATNIISGFAVALECTALPAFVIGLAIISSYHLGSAAVPGGGLFGTAVATMGMLGTAAYILAMDTFGPITDNAGGIIEMSKQPEEIRKKTDRLDAVGNTTKALTKGYAVGSAALAAFLLFSAYMDEIGFYTNKAFTVVDIAKPEIFVAALLGAMLIFWFSSLAINAVQKAAVSVIKEVRRQFAEDPGILAGTSRPNYARCVDIVTVGALKEMVAPGLLAAGMPILVGLVFRQLGLGAEAVAAFLMVATITGILVALMLNNGGGAWDNAKKFIEMGEYGGKGSFAHKAGVVGDTVGDPFKDTAGPSLHVVIKLLSTVTLVLAPLFI